MKTFPYIPAPFYPALAIAILTVGINFVVEGSFTRRADSAMSSDNKRVKGDTLLEIRGLKIEGNSDGVWHPIVKGVDLSLKRGEVLGLIGESGAGKSTIGWRHGLRTARLPHRRRLDHVRRHRSALGAEAQKRELWGSRIAYVAQSAAAAFNPAHKLIDQTIETAVNTTS